MLNFLNEFACLNLPNNNLGVFPSSGNKLIALAHIHVCDVIKMTVERCLKGESVTIPYLDDSRKNELVDLLTHRLLHLW